MEFGKTSGPSRSRSNVAAAASGRSLRDKIKLRRINQQITEDGVELKEAYPDVLNFYTTPPSYSISLQEFEQYAVERLKMLRLIEATNLRNEARYSTEYFEVIRKAVTPNNLPTYDILLGKNPNVYTQDEALYARKVDHISHFLLRLAFARTEEQRKWFITMEVDFFRLKMYYAYAAVDVMLKQYNLPITDATEEAKVFLQDIKDGTFTVDPKMQAIKVYKVHFTYALDLVRSRNVFLQAGYAYVPLHELSTVICLKFRSYLSESLSLLKKNIHLVDDDERLRPLVSGFEKRYLGSSSEAGTNKSGDVVTVAQLADFSQKSFPLCMKHLYDVVEKEHHLKHWGRLQLGLFFKGLGVPIDEATKYWRNNFTKRPEIDSSRFDKQYLYNIRHMYGQEGKRADYTPYSCTKIINSSIGPGDHHGCPFRHSDATPLRVKFVEAGIPQEGIKEIMTLVEQKHFQIACQRYFEWTHDKHTIEGGVHHPNLYFMESRNVLTGKKTIKSESKTEAPRTVYYKNGEMKPQIKTEEEGLESMDVTEAQVDLTEDDGCDELFAAVNY